ncbi:MAG: NTP transferase domain-containing protein [Verrucomicrobia bacterium]|nr:NTP transferase domain-containing protein [Verrucomicrobiota bacterium]
MKSDRFACFILGAGLGTRLRPLTDQLPKPLVPLGLKPLLTYAMDHLIAEAAADSFIVNTHHLPEAYAAAFPSSDYRERAIAFRHEPVLLETGGGIRNIADLWPEDRTLLVYNGDILADLPLAPALAAHRASGRIATLVLRSGGGPQHVAFEAGAGCIRDIRDRFNLGLPHQHVFTGIYLLEREILEHIPEGKISIIPVLIDLLRAGREIGGVCVDDGSWRDLGSRKEYLAAHFEIAGERPPRFPHYGAVDPNWRHWISSRAEVAADAEILGVCAIGPGAKVEAGAILEDTILWPGAVAAAGAKLRNCIVRSGSVARGDLKGKDL